MNTHQKNTYLVYGRGIDPSKLKLGSLFLDPANPQERSPFTFDLNPQILETSTGSPQEDTPCSLEFRASRGWLASLNLLSLVEGKSSQEINYHLKIEGESGVRRQLIEPEKFLNNVVLKSPEAEAWLKSRLSLCRRMYYMEHLVGKAPKIWMLTGIQLITQGSVQFKQGSKASTSGGFTIPVPDPVAGPAAAAMGSGTVAAKANAHSNTNSETVYGHRDARVWAAQFMRLDIKVQSEVPNGEKGQSNGKWVKLRQLVDLKKDGVRDKNKSEDQPAEYANMEQIKVSEAATEQDEEMRGCLSDVDWNLVDTYLRFISTVPEADEGDEDEDNEDEDDEDEGGKDENEEQNKDLDE